MKDPVKKALGIVLLIAATAAVVLLVLFFCGVFPGRGESAAPVFQLQAEKQTVTAHFITPDGEESITLKAGEMLVFPDGDEIDNYTFVGWRNENRQIETRASFSVFQDCYFSAVYAVALNTDEHIPYLFPDRFGLYRPGGDMLRGDAALMIYTLLSVPIYGEDAFIDVSPSAGCFEAVAALKSLGALDGSRFHPDEGITRAELLDILCSFYPASKELYVFSDLSANDPRYTDFCTAAERGWVDQGEASEAAPDHVMTRAETAELMNRVLGRRADERLTNKQLGYLLDVKESDGGYWDMIEACVPHEYKINDHEERWTECSSVEKTAEGLYLFDLALYAVGTDGHLVKDGSYHDFFFDASGVYTSGNAELDEMIRDLFARKLDPSMDREEMLHTMYKYIVNNYTYLRRNFYKYGDVSWAADEACTMISTGKGNCYSFAGAFCMMARALGYDAVVFSGFITDYNSPHAWVEIDIDGETFVFDPEIEYSYKRDYKTANMYMMTMEQANQWYYIR